MSSTSNVLLSYVTVSMVIYLPTHTLGGDSPVPVKIQRVAVAIVVMRAVMLLQTPAALTPVQTLNTLLVVVMMTALQVKQAPAVVRVNQVMTLKLADAGETWP